MLVEAFFSTLVSFCLVQLLHNTGKFNCFQPLFLFRTTLSTKQAEIPFVGRVLGCNV